MRPRALAAMLTLSMLAGCQPPPDDAVDEIEGAHTSKPPKPKDAAPGSLGGICGVNYAKCPSGAALAKKLESLPRTGFVDGCPEDPSLFDGYRKTTVSMKVPRLVDDHKLAQDILKLEMFMTFDTGVADNQGFVKIYRNGVQVAETQTTGEDTSAGWVNLRMGGYETVSAWISHFTDVHLTRALHNRCGSTIVANNECGTIFEDIGGSGCASCRVHKSLLAGAIGLITFEVALGAGASETAAGIMGGASSTTQTFAGQLLSCEKWCGRDKCMTDNCACTRKAINQLDRDSCRQKLESCCNKLGEKTEMHNGSPTGTCDYSNP